MSGEISGRGEPILLDQALELVRRRCGTVAGIETVTVSSADSRILAVDITADYPVPPSDNSAVDGYAFRHADLPAMGGAVFDIIGVSAAGRPFAGKVGPGQAVRIFTGAIPPPGADTIAMQEIAFRQGDSVTIPGGLSPHANIRRAGEDSAAGARVLRAGRRLGPAEIGLLASLGVGEVAVRRPLRVAVLSAGDELVDIGRIRRVGGIYDANRPALLALMRRLGAAATDLGIIPDRGDSVRSALAGAAAGHDAIVTSAGMSVGDEDHVGDAARSLGGLDFWGVAIKPGRPVGVGHIAGVPFFGLPGNPAAMLLSFVLLARPGLLWLAGADYPPPRRLPVAVDFGFEKRQGRREFLRCGLRVGDDGRLWARRFPREGSGILSAFAESDGLLELTETVVSVRHGMILPFIPFAELGL